MPRDVMINIIHVSNVGQRKKAESPTGNEPKDRAGILCTKLQELTQSPNCSDHGIAPAVCSPS